uniref:Death domain-associated protein 6 n=1 Tax=Schistocephalus solidus TaxID=70667 RepID=A0A0X3PHA4_SCHSO
MADDKWIKFTSELRPHLQTTDERILFMLLRKYESTSEEFRRSQAADVFQDCLAQIRAHPSRTYVSLVELKKKLKAHHQCGGDDEVKAVPRSPPGTKSPQGTPQMLSISTSPLLGTERTPMRTNVNPSSSLPCVEEVESSLRQSESLQQSSVTASTDGSATNVSSLPKVESSEPRDDAPGDPKLYRIMVQSLEHKLEFISSEIRKLEEAELDLSDLDNADSPYLRLDRLKRQHLRIWNQLCRVRKISPRCGRVVRRRFTYNGSRFASVNRAVENMVNASKNFPDFMDIQRLVENVLVKNQNVKMSQTALNCLAREVFTDVGRLLKDRRQKDVMLDFGCHLTDEARNEVDPAVADPELRLQLRANRKRGAAKLEEVLTKYSRLQEAYEDGLATTDLVPDSDTSSETASLAPPHSSFPSPAPASSFIPAPQLTGAPLAEAMDEALSPLVLHSAPLEEQLSLGESVATLDTVIIIESDAEEEEEDLESHGGKPSAPNDAAAAAAQTANQGSPFPLDHLQLPSAFIPESDDDADNSAVLPIDPTSQAEICESVESTGAPAASLNPAVREAEECITVDCDGGGETEFADDRQQSPSTAAVPSTPAPEILPVSDCKKCDDKPHSEISLLDSDGENEVKTRKTHLPSPTVSLPLHDAAVDSTVVTVSSTIPPGTEVISIDSDGEERQDDDDDDEPEVVDCTLPSKAMTPLNHGRQRPCLFNNFSPRPSNPNFHPSSFSLGNPQLVTQISEQRVISVSTNVFGCPVTSSRIVQQRQDLVFSTPAHQHDSFYPPPLMMPRGFSRFPGHSWHPSPYQRFFQSNF